MFDIHRHLKEKILGEAQVKRDVCLISRAPNENGACRTIALIRSVACALFASPDASDWLEVCKLVSDRQVLAYFHCEQLSFSRHSEIAPLLRACETSALPLIVHLSRHDGVYYSQREAAKWLHFLRWRWPAVPLIVSHLGGENSHLILRAMKADANIMADLSCWNQTVGRAGFSSNAAFFDTLVANAKASQLLYGSDGDWPGDDHDDAELVSSLSSRMGQIDVRRCLDENAVGVFSRIQALN